jgi:ATP-binding protein involved in chromosome partitioning
LSYRDNPNEVAETPAIWAGDPARDRRAQVPVSPDEVPVVAVASGKGGVGKTTVAVNLALALAAGGVRTGLVDADLYGPDVPRMLGLRRREESSQLTVFSVRGTAAARLQAVERYGIQLASAGFLIGEAQGLGVAAGLAQLLVRRLINDTDWDSPECLVIDLPPGTADIQQFVFALRGRPVHVLVVVTPQVIAHQDVRRLLADLQMRASAGGGAEIIGGVENYCGLICAHCGELTPMFPPAPPGDSVWEQVERIVSVPFSPAAAADADQGKPAMVTRAVPELVSAFELLASRVRKQLAQPGPSGRAAGG